MDSISSPLKSKQAQQGNASAETTTTITGSPSKKVTSLRKMVRGARKAMERKPEKAASKGKDASDNTNSGSSLLKLAGLSQETRSLRKLNTRSDSFATDTSSSSLSLGVASEHTRHASSGKLTSPKKSITKASSPMDYNSPQKSMDKKLPYIVHEHAQHTSPSKYGSAGGGGGSIQKQFSSPTKYGSPRKFRSPQKTSQRNLPYSVNTCAPPYVQDEEEEDDDEVSMGSSNGFTVNGDDKDDEDTSSSLGSSWGTIDQDPSSTSVPSNPSALGLRGIGLARQPSNSSLVSWGDLSIGADDDESGLRHIPLMVNL